MARGIGISIAAADSIGYRSNRTVVLAKASISCCLFVFSEHLVMSALLFIQITSRMPMMLGQWPV